MMTARTFNSQCLQNYPKIQIDRANVIKPCIAEQTASDLYIRKPCSSWIRILQDTWCEGIPFLLKYASDIQVPVNSNIYYTYFLKVIKYIAFLMLHVHRVYLYIYEYFYPYSLMPHDKVCDIFSGCPKWSESIIRAFAWHPHFDRCALAIFNDFVHVYQGPTRIRVLRHYQQRKVVDLAWKPSDKEVLAVATQSSIILWRISNQQACPLVNLKDNSLFSPTVTNRLPVFNPLSSDPVIDGSAKDVQQQSLVSKKTDKNFHIISDAIDSPIVSIKFEGNGKMLYASSPNSSKIAVLDIEKLFGQNSTESGKKVKDIYHITRYGQGITKLSWSPKNDRLATATTSSFIRVFEPFKWSCSKWKTEGIIQDMTWSKPDGRILLMANKHEPCLYALPFLDTPQANDVGGIKSITKVLDLTATESGLGGMVGGLVQSLVWDKNGKRLAISFKENPESILLYRTTEKPFVEFHQLGIIQSDSGSSPLFMEFHDNFKNGCLLTICWSDGNCQHIPLSYTAQDMNKIGLTDNDTTMRDLNGSRNMSGIESPHRTLRSLTNFCHVSGNNSISSSPHTLRPINKAQHQAPLFSLSKSQSSILQKESHDKDE